MRTQKFGHFTNANIAQSSAVTCKNVRYGDEALCTSIKEESLGLLSS